MTSTRAFFIALAVFTAQLLISPAEARQHHRHSAVQHLDPGCNVIFPCTPIAGQSTGHGSPFAGARSIRITMHRDRKAAHKAPAAHHEASHPRATKLQDRVVEEGRGVIRSVSGAVAYVAATARGAFQCLVSSLDDAGYKIEEMGGFADHGHIRHSKHYSGMALDINQVERNVVTRRFPAGFEHMAASCGLESGSRWRNADTGHFETTGPVHYASRHHRVRYAHRRRDHRYAGAG